MIPAVSSGKGPAHRSARCDRCLIRRAPNEQRRVTSSPRCDDITALLAAAAAADGFFRGLRLTAGRLRTANRICSSSSSSNVAAELAGSTQIWSLEQDLTGWTNRSAPRRPSPPPTSTHPHPPPSLEALRDLLLTSWCQIPQQTFRGLVEIVARQVRPVLTANVGGVIKLLLMVSVLTVTLVVGWGQAWFVLRMLV